MTIRIAMVSLILLPIISLAQQGPPVGPAYNGPGGPARGWGRAKHHRGVRRGKNRHKCPILMMYNRITEQLPEALGLSDAQMDKYNEIKKQHKQRIKEICEQLKAERESFKADLESILTPDQKEKLQQLQRQMHHRRRAQMGNWRKRAGRRPLRPRIILQAVKQMNLSEDKIEKLKEIFQDTRNRVQSSDRSDKKEMREIFRDMMEQIKQVLSPEEYERMKVIARDLQSSQREYFNQPRRRGGRMMPERGYRHMRGERGNRPGQGGRWQGPDRGWRGWDNRERPVPPPPPEQESQEEFLW